jgi:hypothetical protein
VLLDADQSELRLNVRTGHPNNAHTVVTNYFDLNSKRNGDATVARALLPAVFANADYVFEQDNAESQVKMMKKCGGARGTSLAHGV